MSSHHIVRENQEPALIIANGEMCSMQLLTEILEWCPYVVALDGAYDQLLSLGIQPNTVIGDFDSLQTSERDRDVTFLQVEEQESTDLEKGVAHLIERGYANINIVWAWGKRIDHTINNFTLLTQHSEINIVFYDDFGKSFLLPKKFLKHYPKGLPISLIPISLATNISTNNLKYSLNEESLELGKRSGTSNEVLDNGIVSISYESGNLVLVEGTVE